MTMAKKEYIIIAEVGTTKCSECLFYQGLCRFPDELHPINCYELNLATLKVKERENKD